MAELLLGCGNRHKKLIFPLNRNEWTDLTTLDIDPNCGADVEWDLERIPLPFDAESFDEIHAYNVLEHTGRLGDWKFFFSQWTDFYRMLKPDGVVCGIVPLITSIWAFGDPGHTRIIHPACFTFLDQEEYTKQVGNNALADYRRFYKADFKLVHISESRDELFFVLKAEKPSRISV